MRDSMKNIKETWEQNEKELQNQDPARIEKESSAPADGLEALVKKEAEEYDHTDAEEKLLSGGRATLNDDGNASEGG